MISPTELRCRLSTSGDLFRVHKKLEDRGKPLEAAMLIGCAPALMLAGATTIGPDNSELDFAARITGMRFPMRACDTIDLSVPSTTEFVIEGELLAGERRPEGPYGDWMDYYIPVMNNHVFRVRKALARKNAMFYAVAAGSPEEMAMSAIPIAGMIYRAIRTYVPSVLDVVCYPFPQFCVVQIKKGFEGQARKAMLGAFGAEMNRLLYCVVVDEDVNAHDLRDVIWAMTTRCRPDRDVFIIPEVPSFARDPHQMHWGRMGIDATAPLEYGAEFERKRTPGEGDIRLEDYLS
jgi:4-hydroxybenzoate decarboxylase